MLEISGLGLGGWSGAAVVHLPAAAREQVHDFLWRLQGMVPRQVRGNHQEDGGGDGNV